MERVQIRYVGNDMMVPVSSQVEVVPTAVLSLHLYLCKDYELY